MTHEDAQGLNLVNGLVLNSMDLSSTKDACGQSIYYVTGRGQFGRRKVKVLVAWAYED